MTLRGRGGSGVLLVSAAFLAVAIILVSGVFPVPWNPRPLASGARSGPSASAAPLLAWANVTQAFCPPCGAEPWRMVANGTATGGEPPYQFAWNFGNGSLPVSGANAAFDLPYSGDYLVVLTVTDRVGDQATALASYDAMLYTTQWVAARASPAIGMVPLTVDFAETGPYPSYSSLLWSFGDGGSTTDAAANHTYTRQGTYLALLNATFPDGSNATFAITVDALGTGSPLVVSANATTSTFCPPPVTDRFQTAVAGGAPPYSYAWSFGDGGTGSSADPTHTYANDWAHTATVVVTDASGRTATTQVAEAIEFAPCAPHEQVLAPPYAIVLVLSPLIVAVATAAVIITARRRERKRARPPISGPPASRYGEDP